MKISALLELIKIFGFTERNFLFKLHLLLKSGTEDTGKYLTV